MSHKRGGRRAAGAHPKKKSGGLLIGLRGGMKKAVGAPHGHAKSHHPGAGGAGALGKLWTVLTILLLVGAAVLLLRRFTGP